jgi:hypothetical protein
MTTLQTFRDTLRRILPPWLQHGNAELIMFAIGVHIDAIADATVAGAQLRFPGFNGTALPLLGRERRIARGRKESNATYAARLTRWLTDHQRRGGPYAMLAQLHAYYAPDNFPIELIYTSGRRFSMDVAGNVVRDDPDTSLPLDAWGIDPYPPEKWAQWFLVLHWPSAIKAEGTWDDDPAPWDDPTTVWDLNITPADMVDIRLVPTEWNAAHCIGWVRLRDPGGAGATFSIR